MAQTKVTLKKVMSKDAIKAIKKEVVMPNVTKEEFDAVVARLERLEALAFGPKEVTKSINKVEAHTAEEASTVESYNGIKMGLSDKINSMRNAIKILPPNMIKEGRHSKSNIEAICGFKIDEDMMDQVYIDFVHEA